MAQNTLQTVLQLVGGPQYVAQINRAAQAHQQLANAQMQQARAQAQVQRAIAAGRAPSARQQAVAGGVGLPGGLGASIGGIAAAAAISTLAMAIKDATLSFVDYDRAVLRAEFTMKDLGHGMPIAELRDFARTIALTTGTAETDLIKLAGYLGRFKTDSETMKRAMQTINDASAATGLSVEELAKGFEEARRGHGREFFKELGIPIRGVEGQLYSLDQIVQIVDKHFHGFAQQMGRELPGELDKTTAAFQAMAHEAGRLASPLLEGAARILRRSALGYMAFFKDMATRLGIPEAGSTQSTGAGTPGIGGPGKSRSDEYLKRIEQNTGPQGALGRALRGGGAYGELGGGLHIRDFNRLFRHQ